MKYDRRYSKPFATLLLLMALTATVARSADSLDETADPTPTWTRFRPVFVENLGQLENPSIRFHYRSPQVEIAFSDGAIWFHQFQRESLPGGLQERTEGVLFSLSLGNPLSRPEPEDLRPGRSNFLVGIDPSSWRSGARHFGRIRYRSAFPGTDLIFFFDSEDQLTYELWLEPGVDSSAIELSYIGVDGLDLVSPSMIRIQTAIGSLEDGELTCFQQLEGKRHQVRSAFRILGPNSYGVELLDPVDPERPLVVDPKIRFSTYWGSGGANNRTVVIDRSGNVYLSGGTSSPDWPTTPGAYDTIHSGAQWPDVTAAKFDPAGEIVWSTLIGGPSEDYAYVSAVNNQGELYLVGRAGRDFPTTPGAFDRSFNGGKGGGPHAPTDAFVLKLSTNGDRLLYSTYIGGRGDDNGRAIHLLPSGELLVAGGNSDSPDLPVTNGAFKTRKSGALDSWIGRVSADGTRLVFLTYFGPNNDTRPDETIRALGVDSSGDIWLGGTTTGNDIQATPDAFQQKPGGGRSDTYIGKLSSDGKRLEYFSWLGGSGFDEIETEGVSDTSGNFFVAGSTASKDFPFSPNAYRPFVEGTDGALGGDGFVARINENGTLGFATAYGGSQQGEEGLFGPVVDSQGRVYVTGRFHSRDCPVTPEAFQSKNSGAQDAVLAIFSSDGSRLLYGSYIGGSGTDHGRHIGIHPNGKSVAIAIETNSSDLPLENAQQTAPAGAALVTFDVSDLSSGSSAKFRSGFEEPDFADWDGRHCSACSVFQGALGSQQRFTTDPFRHEHDSSIRLRGDLVGPKSGDFDLYLRQWLGNEWVVIAMGLGPNSQEVVDFAAGRGTYSWEVKSVEGGGEFRLQFEHSSLALDELNRLLQSRAARKKGQWGLESIYTAGARNKDYLIHRLKNATGHYETSFWIRPGSALSVRGNDHHLLQLLSDKKVLVTIYLLPTGSTGDRIEIAARARSSGGGWLGPITLTLDRGRWSRLSLDWQAQSSANSADGFLRLFQNDKIVDELEGPVDRLGGTDRIYFGQISRSHRKTSGRVLIDQFKSNWDG